MVKLNKLGGSTLVEVIVAMVIITMVISLTFNFYVKVNKSSNYLVKLKAHMISEEVICQCKIHKEFKDENYNFDNVIIQKIITPYENYDDLKRVEIIALSMDKKEFFRKTEIISIKP